MFLTFGAAKSVYLEFTVEVPKYDVPDKLLLFDKYPTILPNEFNTFDIPSESNKPKILLVIPETDVSKNGSVATLTVLLIFCISLLNELVKLSAKSLNILIS